jgi:hypothetical protein
MRYFFSIAFFICCLNGYSQVKFEKLGLNEALQKSSITGKMLFAQFQSESCEQCNDVADRAFQDPELAKIIAQRCIAIKIAVASQDRAEFVRRFPTASTLGTYFIIGSGELIHRFVQTTTLPSAYVNEINTAYNKWQEGIITLKELDEEWTNNAGNVLAMEKLLDKRLSVSLPTDSLLEIYVKRLPPDSLNSKRLLTFIANHSPVLGSEADKILRRDRDVFNMVWYGIPLQQRINLNGKIVAKSLQKAIEAKNEAFVRVIAAFQVSTYDDRNSETARRNNDNLFLNYYQGVKDHEKYLKLKISYVDNYFMIYPVNFILQQDSIKRQSLLKNVPGDTVRGANGVTIRKILSFAPVGQFYAKELNDGAWHIYTNTNDTSLLKKAVLWAKRANEFYESAASMDTYARLLYKTGNQKEAIEWETKAIQQQKDRMFSYKRFEDILQKMSNGEVKIDEYSL